LKTINIHINSELREEFHVVSIREQEYLTKRKDIEKRLETAEAESASVRNDLRLALQRIADLQQAMEDNGTESSDRFVLIITNLTFISLNNFYYIL